MSDARIPLAGVIGSPVAHSKSPRLHRHWLTSYGVRGHYIPMDVTHDNLEEVIRTLPKMGFVGVNITIPHKEKVMSLADQITDRATLIGAANTLIFRQDGRILADNTDGYGFIENLRQGAQNAYGPDGSVFVGLTNRGWSSLGTSAYGLQRLVWTGEVPFEIQEMRAAPDGLCRSPRPWAPR